MSEGIEINDEYKNDIVNDTTASAPSCFRQNYNYVIVDVEVGMKDKKIHDIGALKCDFINHQ